MLQLVDLFYMYELQKFILFYSTQYTELFTELNIFRPMRSDK